ncbi:MAG: GGDEF domain-containing response regulator [Glaciecola sp.]
MLDTPTTLAIVEDNPADTTHYMRLLEQCDHNFQHIECFTTIECALKSLKETKTNICCLLDYNLPDGTALSLVKALKSGSCDLICPIVIITGQNDTQSAVKLLKLGVQDYIVKDELSSNSFIRTIEGAVQNWQLKKQLEFMAMYDSLTQLGNRCLFIDKLEQMISEGSRYNHGFTLITLDLNNFKSVNDIYGHEAGDFVLQQVGIILRRTLRDADIAGRLGGDEFAILLPETCRESALIVAEKVADALDTDIEWHNAVIPVSAALGISMFPSKARNAMELMREADIALYKCKENKNAKYECYRQGWMDENAEKEKLRNYLPTALQDNKFEIALQAIVHSRDNERSIFAFEILTRLCFEGRWVNPITIVNMVIELGLDIAFHRWLFSSAFMQLKKLQVQQPNMKISLNLPANVCHSPRLTNLLVDMTQQHDIAPNDVILEVTETHLMVDPDKARQCLCNLVNSGFSIAIDDFGTGYSSMEYIADLPCSFIKIDKKFFLNLEENKRNRNIIEAITALAHGLEMVVIAEGIESATLVDEALELECDFLQGFYYGQPVIPTDNDDLFKLQNIN